MCQETYNGWRNWGTWYIALELMENDVDSNEECYESYIEKALCDAYGDEEQSTYNNLLLAHEECDYQELEEHRPLSDLRE